MTAAQWPPRRTSTRGGRSGPDLEALTGLRSGKPHYYPEHRHSAERLRRVIHALDRISAALVRTMEGSDALVRAVVDAAADHLSAEWVVFALVDGELPDARRGAARGPLRGGHRGAPVTGPSGTLRRSPQPRPVGGWW